MLEAQTQKAWPPPETHTQWTSCGLAFPFSVLFSGVLPLGMFCITRDTRFKLELGSEHGLL